MKPFQANLINAIVLISLGMWGYYETQAPTSLIAPASGAILLALHSGLKKENKAIAHAVVLITFLLLLSLVMPLMKREGTAMLRVATMMVSCAIAMFVFIKNFRDVRKAREAANK